VYHLACSWTFLVWHLSCCQASSYEHLTLVLLTSQLWTLETCSILIVMYPPVIYILLSHSFDKCTYCNVPNAGSSSAEGALHAYGWLTEVYLDVLLCRTESGLRCSPPKSWTCSVTRRPTGTQDTQVYIFIWLFIFIFIFMTYKLKIRPPALLN